MLCNGDQGGLFRVMNSLLEGKSDPTLPHSLSDANMAASFSRFFSEKIMHIRRNFELDLGPSVFSVDFNACPGMITTFFYRSLNIYLCRECKK